MKIQSENMERVRSALLGGQGEILIRLMQHKSLSWDTDQFPNETVQLARDLGWIDEPTGYLTDAGILAADSCREYQFWLEREKTLPFEDAAPHLSREYFKDRALLEIGSGMGANLMSLSATASRVCGVEPVKAYAQLGGIFCEREGIVVPDVRQGSAESLPFENGEADFILCISAHQYFDIGPALNEIARVLAAGGELIVVGGTFRSYLREGWKELVQRRGGTKAFVITVVNTLSYMLTKRRLILGRKGFSTARPIYPTRSAMRRWFADAGLQEISPICEIGAETCFHLRKLS